MTEWSATTHQVRHLRYFLIFTSIPGGLYGGAIAVSRLLRRRSRTPHARHLTVA